MEKQWFCQPLSGGMSGLSVQVKAHRRALAFLDQNNLKPQEVHITEGYYSKSIEPDDFGSVYMVYVWYLATGPLTYEDPPELRTEEHEYKAEPPFS